MGLWSQIDSRSLSISSPLRKYWILGDLVAFLIQLLPTFMKLGTMTDDDKVMNPQHFGR